MEQKDLKKIKRKELLELMLEQAKRIQELELEIKDLKSELDSKKIKIKESGSIAEAALKLNNIYSHLKYKFIFYKCLFFLLFNINIFIN